MTAYRAKSGPAVPRKDVVLLLAETSHRTWLKQTPEVNPGAELTPHDWERAIDAVAALEELGVLAGDESQLAPRVERRPGVTFGFPTVRRLMRAPVVAGEAADTEIAARPTTPTGVEVLRVLRSRVPAMPDFKPGVRVRVINPRSDYFNQVGTVASPFDTVHGASIVHVLIGNSSGVVLLPEDLDVIPSMLIGDEG